MKELPNNLSKIAEGNGEAEAEHDFILAFKGDEILLARLKLERGIIATEQPIIYENLKH